MIENVLKDKLNVGVDLSDYDLGVKENFGERKEVTELRRAAEEGCSGSYDRPTASLNKFCAVALNLLDLVDELADEVFDLGLEDP